ncbi:MAG: hypothetical protein ABI995_10580, partial [Acidobacteriota bacterium]
MNESLLVNTLGHSAGVLLFGIFLVLLLQDRTARSLPRGRKSMCAATLALAWNLASLVVLGSDKPDSMATQWMVAIGFSVLSLLPAVLFDLCLEDRYRGLTMTGYGLAMVTIIPHVVEVFHADADVHRLALTSITIGFGALTAIAAGLEYLERGGRATSRLIGTMSLFLLAMSFVHLGGGHAEQIWSQELAFHHAAIPLALLVLLQDYRFVLLDAFLRFLANVLLAVAFVTAAVFAWQWRWLPSADTPFHLALLLAGACLLLILFAVARGAIQRLLTRIVFRRPNPQTLMQALRMPVRDEETYLAGAVRLLANYAGAEAVMSAEAAAGANAILPLRVASGVTRYVVFGRRTGGRRYLSEDLEVLRRASAVIAEQLDVHH